MKNYLKIFGERNTNTNYLSQLVDLNFDLVQRKGTVPKALNFFNRILFNNSEWYKNIYFSLTEEVNLGWKHKYIDPKAFSSSDKSLLIITLTKNPYAWLLSMYRNPYHMAVNRNLSFSEFLRSEIVPLSRENLKGLKKINIIELWNVKNRSYLAIEHSYKLNLKSIDLIINTESILSLIKNHFSIKYTSGKFEDFSRSTKDKSKDKFYYLNYYKNELWRDKLSEADYAFINQKLDSDLMKAFSFDYITTP